MKNLATFILLAIAVTFTANAQEKTGQKNKQNRPQFTAEQHTELSVKRLTLALDLNEKQQNQIKPLLMAQATQRKAAMEKMKKARENKQRPSEEEIFAMENQKLDNQIAMKNKMKEILTKEQFEKFEKIAKMRKMKGEKMMEARKGMKNRMHENEDKK
ncbi:hypothetical protein [Polaribacter sp.]|uniref:hypothetical protein n=1 Tax=Polaribacter sp. TaxID=1920175 RepID=UPI004048E03C